MDQTLVGMGLKLQDVGGARQIGDLNRGQLLADLRDAGVPARQRTWFALQPPEAVDRILLARDDRSQKCEGALLIQYRSAGSEPFLAIEALSGAPAMRGEALLRRMVAFLLLRLDMLEARPVAILACTRNPTLCRVLHDIAAGIGGARFYPDHAGAVVSLETAAIAHRLAGQIGAPHRFAATREAMRAGAGGTYPEGRMLALLDVRAVWQAALDDDARRIFRARLPRSAGRPATANVVLLQGNGPVSRPGDFPRIPAPLAALAVRGAGLYPVGRFPSAT